jgi:UDP-N-acetylmuramate dehydrogenase
VQIEQNIPLAPFTTLHIGGPARYFAQATKESDLLEAVSFVREEHLPLFILGGGSNLVVPDEGYPGLVLQVAIQESLIIDGPKDEFPPNRFTRYLVPAGVGWDQFVDQACAAGLSGVECLAGIPGLIGGSPVQNIGAYGQEVSQTIFAVHAFDLGTLKPRQIPASECGFAYRTSIFNSKHRDRYVITRVAFDFSLDASPRLTYPDLKQHFDGHSNPTPTEIAAAVRQIRATKGMYLDPAAPSPDHRSAGSFFKNPIVPPTALGPIAHTLAIPEAEIPHWPTPSGEVKLPAAWLIEQAGFPKGFNLGPVGISSRHTLALINRTGTATCADLLALRDLIITEVAARFHITLEQEPVFLR